MTETTSNTDDAVFVRAIHARPLDTLPRLIFADWLDEHDRPAEAAWLRADVRAGQAHPNADAGDLDVMRAGPAPDGVPSLWLAKSIWGVSWAAASLFLSLGQSLFAALRRI